MRKEEKVQRDWQIELFIRSMKSYRKRKKSFIFYLNGYRGYYIKLNGFCKSSWPFRID